MTKKQRLIKELEEIRDQEPVKSDSSIIDDAISESMRMAFNTAIKLAEIIL